MTKDKFDLIIIGGGAASFAASIKANELGAKTAIINGGLPVGGTCVNVGCIPSKLLLHTAEVLYLVKNHGIQGIELEVKNFDFKAVIKNELEIVRKFRNEKYEKVLANLANVTYIRGKAVFSGKKEVTVGNQKFTADKFIIATGSTTTVPNIAGIEEIGYLTHVNAMSIKSLPKEMAVIGAGPVGLELAQVFVRFGTKITILQSNKSIFPKGEKELTTQLAQLLEQEGIIIKTGISIESVKSNNNKKILTYNINGETKELAVNEILLATGKTANTKSLNLNTVGVKVDGNDSVIVNGSFQTNIEYISAIGDVTNLPIRLETTAGHEGTLAAENILKQKKNNIDYNTVPYAIFTDPQYASVGLTEKKQMDKFGVCSCKTVPFNQIPKASILRRTEGLIKMGIDPQTKQILGIHILAPNAGDLIAQAMVIIKNKNTVYDVLNSEPVFPTMSEAIKYVALAFTKDLSQLSCCI